MSTIGRRRPLLSRRWALLFAAAGAVLSLVACSPGAADRGTTRPAAVARGPALEPVTRAADTGVWYAFKEGRPVSVVSPSAATASFEPWTVQDRVAGFLKLGSELYIAVNGWGMVTLPETAAGAPHRAAFGTYDEPRLFGGRTINGFYVEKGEILLHLYRNTVFATDAPRSSALTFVRFDAATTHFTAVRLPPSRENWEAVDVVHTAGGRWAFAWKKSSAVRTQFRFFLYDPATGAEKPIDRSAFFATYGFLDVAAAPSAVRTLARLATARVGVPAKSGVPTVLHLEVRGAPYERIERFRLGAEKLLTAGDARLITLPVLRTARRFYALLPAGRLLWVSRTGGAPREGELRLPALPAGFVYTDFWTDGRLLVTSWERQRFAEVAAAGIYRVVLTGAAAGRSAAGAG